MRLGGILADDMGLGKTLQTLIYLMWLKHLKKRGKANPSLVICPASVMHNWRREVEKFTPDMSVLVLESGTARHRMRKHIPDHDIVVTNYSLLRRDLEDLQKYKFDAVILDEAQFIKNPGAQVTQSVKQLKCKTRLALTGTPLENRLLDLWSITDFVQPNYLGDEKHFHETYDPSGGDGEEAVANRRIARKRLSSRLRPILLRRLKTEVAKDLPERIEQRHDCELGTDQRKLYLAELRRSRDTVMETIQTKGVAKSRMQVLAALTRLRQICCHPSLVGNNSASGKTEALFDLLEPLVAQGEKVLVFSQFVQMLKILEKDCGTREISTHMLTGATKNRQDVVNAFQESEGAGVFLLSLRAAGTGLNLTTASYVVLYDPWWNPAVEAQAIDRTHRIGQTKTVNAYKLIAPGTVEEKIWNLQQSKQQTISDVLGEKGFAKSLSRNDLEFLFSED
jgi:non-specific serine/threonine protein kinase